MLPAKFRGFASRVCRLASRALVWHKDGERDGATARTSGNSSSSSTSGASSAASILFRAILALFVAAATLFATFVVPPVHNTNAAGKANVFWDYIGTGYISPSSVDNHDIWRDIDFQNPVIKTENVNGRKKTTITWEVLYNKEACRIKAMENPLMKCDPKDGSHSYDGQPEFYAVLPSGVKDETVRITRYRTEFDRTGFYNGRPGAKFYSWHLRGNENEEPGKFNSGTNVTRIPGDAEYDELWNQHIATCGIFSNEACEAWNWKKQGKFGRLFKTWEQNNSVTGIRWIISAEVKDNQDPYNLPFMAGFVSYRNGSDKNKFIIWGPYDHDGDGIPDSKEWHYGFNPTSDDDVQFPKKSKKDAVYGEITDVDPYFKTGHWDGTAEKGKWIYDNTEKPFEQTDTGITFSFKKSGGKEVLPDGVTKANSPNNMQPGQAYIDPITGKLKYNPKKTDRDHTIHFDVQITYPNPSENSCKYKKQVEQVKGVDIHVVSQASLYNPHYETTEVDSDPSKGTFSPATSVEPKSVRDRKKPWVRVGSLPNGSTFKLEQYTKYSLPVLDWSNIDSKNTGNGKVTFSPPKSEAGKSEKTPVVVTYPDGSTSKDKDSGNSGNPVYAPVTVGDLPISGGDLNLGLYDGTSINNNGFWGFSFRSKTNPHEIDKGKKMGLPDDDNKNPNKGIVFDSWANNGKGPITFRVICHRTDVPNSPFALLKPAEGNKEASGEINGLKFEDFRQWIRDNDKRCKGKDCSNDNLYLHSREYDNNTMERSRAMIGGTPREGGSYECKVFAFHEKYDDKNNHGGSLDAFDKASSGDSIALQSLFTNYETAKKDAKGSEWVASSFYFKIKLKDNQKYNPTYVKIPTIQAGKSIKDGRYSSPTKDSISTDQPKSTKAGNGVPEKEQASILDDYLPDGTWFEIKKLIKKVDKKDPKDCPKESVQWSRFEDSEDNVKRGTDNKPVKDKNGKVVTLDQPNRDYGSVTFHPDKWQSAGQYWAEVIVHYPDGSTSDGEGSVNKDHPVYAKVNVTPKPGNNTFGLNLFRYTNDSSYRTISVENGINLHPGDLLSGNDRPKFDAYLTNAVGNLHEHMICSKQGKNGKQADYTYGMLPGHVNNENSKNENEKDGLRLLEPQTIWKHSSLKDQLECNANSKKCKSDTYLYDDWVDGDKSRDTFERTHGFFGGVAQKTGDYVCKVYVIRGDDKKSDEFKKAVEANIKSKKNEDPVPSVLNAKGNPYGTEGEGYKTGSFSVHIHKDNQKYNPTYTEMPTIEAGSTFDKNLKKGNKAKISSDAPQSKKTVKDSNNHDVNANGVPKEDLVNVEEGALPAGTWYEIKRFVKASDVKNSKANSLPWANFEDGEDNKADGKQEAKDGNATGKGSVTFRPDKWQDDGEYWAEVVVHYPDGSSTDQKDSINYGHPVYAKVKVTRPAIGNKDLHLNVYKQYENGKFTGYVDDVNGIVVMKGVGLLKDMGIDSWSTAKPEGITLRALCRDDSDEARKKQPQVWSENLDNLFFKLNWQQAWKYPTFARQETCRKGSNNGDGCDTGNEHLLFDSTRDTMERARGTITSDKAPTKSGKYYCVVLAMKKEAMDQYNKALWHTNGKISVTNNNFAKAIGFTGKSDEDYAVKFFPVTVVDKFALPKTGGMNWNVLLGAFAVIGTGVMAVGFFLEQTKWGRAMLDALLRKTLIKDFICKTAKKLRALRRRSERWRC